MASTATQTDDDPVGVSAAGCTSQTGTDSSVKGYGSALGVFGIVSMAITEVGL